MLELESLDEIKRLFNSLDKYRKCLEDVIEQDSSSYFFHCSYCQCVTRMTITYTREPWTDLRGQFSCEGCGLYNRERLFYQAILSLSGADSGRTLIFERVTRFYNKLAKKIPQLHGVEFGGYELSPGALFDSKFGRLEHQDMQHLSYKDASFDLVLHSDVLEHIPDPFQAMREVHRVLKPGGVCLFSTPIFSNRYENLQTAYLRNGEPVFTGEPKYHGDPLSAKGVPVFHEFGLNLIDDMKALGFKASYLIELSLLGGIFSNNNPYPDIGHMWPIVVKVKKETRQRRLFGLGGS